MSGSVFSVGDRVRYDVPGHASGSGVVVGLADRPGGFLRVAIDGSSVGAVALVRARDMVVAS